MTGSLTDLYPLGQVTDLGDVYEQRRLIIKGRHIAFRTHDGTEHDTGPADRIPNTTIPTPPATERINAVRDLAQDKKFTRTYAPVDEFGVPTAAPFDGVMAFSTDSPGLINLTDNGDGSCVIAAVGGGALGPASLSFVATPNSGGAPFQVTDVINVVPGAAEGFVASDSADEEVTPDVP